MGATRAAVAEVLGRREVAVERCTLWPALAGCQDDCLALPANQVKRMRKGEAPPRDGADAGIKTILVPLDGSPGSESVLPMVGELARAQGAKVRLLLVAAPAAAVMDDNRILVYADQETERVERETHDYFRRLAMRIHNVAVEESVRYGEPLGGILKEAESSGADLIAMATHRRGLLGGLVKGSVAARLKRETTIPLFLVPYGEPEAA